jgi:hypothetical protein
MVIKWSVFVIFVLLHQIQLIPLWIQPQGKYLTPVNDLPKKSCKNSLHYLMKVLLVLFNHSSMHHEQIEQLHNDLGSMPRFGCGTWIFYLKNEKEYFPACQLHDIEYELQWPDIKILESDRLFLQRMTQLSDWSFGYIVRAYFYYFIVRVAGWYYRKRAKAYSEDDIATYNEVIEKYFD